MRAMIALLLLGLGSVAAPRPSRIEGHVHYPACFPPSDLAVCAATTDGTTERCTSRFSMTELGIHYRLEVPAGTYLVYATSETYFPGYRAHFSRAVVCGLSTECRDHAPIPVTVEPGQTVRHIDPDDWFAPVRPPPPSV